MSSTKEAVFIPVRTSLDKQGFVYDGKDLVASDGRQFKIATRWSGRAYDAMFFILKKRDSWWTGHPEFSLGSISFIEGMAEINADQQTTRLCNARHITLAEAFGRNARADQNDVGISKEDNRFYTLFNNEKDEKKQLGIIEEDPALFKFIQQPTAATCMAAVKARPANLAYCVDQTAELCCAAIEADPQTLTLCGEQTDAICLAAVKKQGRALRYVERQTLDICLEAVKQDPSAVNFMSSEMLRAMDHRFKPYVGFWSSLWYSVSYPFD
jgi:hypothetical protein